MKYTMFVPISREDYAPLILDSIIAMDFPVAETELIVLADTQSQRFVTLLGCALEVISKTKGIRNIKMKMTGEKPLADDAPLMERRQRVMSIWNKMIGMIGHTEIFFGLEDDTVPPDEAFKILVAHVEAGVPYAEGVQRHRQASSIGAWRITPNTARTLKYKASGTSTINGGGWYCFATRTEYVKKAMIREDGAPMGPDVCFVYDIVKRIGRKGIVDWSIKCGHRTTEGILYADKNTGQLFYVGKRALGDWVKK